MKFWKQPLTTKVAISFLFLSLLTVGIVGGVAHIRAREALKKAAFDRLNVTARLKEKEIARWFENQQRDFLLTTQFPDVQKNLQILTSPTNSKAQQQDAYGLLSKYLTQVIEFKPNFRKISLLNRSNQIILSTKKANEGNYEIGTNLTYIEEVESGDTFAPIFYVSPMTGKPAVTLATPLRNRAGDRQGMILTELNLEQIDGIVRESMGLGESGETYLVGSLVTKNVFISKANSPNPNQQTSEGITSQGIDRAMSGESGTQLYRNYAGVPVIGVYRWLNDQDIALLVEMEQEEAFAPARQLAATIVLVALAAAAILLVGVYWLSRQLTLSRQQLEIKAQEADTANQAKSEFLANMSHELRTPLNAILGFAQLLDRDTSLSSQQKKFLATINRSGEHLLDLINDVLQMSKIEAGRTVLTPDVFDLHSLLQTLHTMFQVRAAAKGLTLNFHLDPDLPQYILTDEGKLRQVLINLLSNAIKFTPAGSVTLKAKGKQWQKPPAYPLTSLPPQPQNFRLSFSLEDTGIGIAPEELNQLFRPFVQTASGVKSPGGTGLGLTISRKFIQLMGGDIQVQSTLGKGSSFHFTIKVTLAQPTVNTELAPERRVLKIAPHQPTYRLLVADDKEENRNLLVQLLQTVGFQTRIATNGSEAIAQWQTWKPDLIWMDMRMPIVDGYEATKKIKLQATSSGQKAKIIALTAAVFAEQQEKIFKAGCDDIVCKPFREQIIFEKIAQHIGVKYIYEGESQGSLKEAKPTTLNYENLKVMPQKWQERLHQAAVEVDGEAITQLIKQIPSHRESLATGLAQLNRSYDFDGIIELLEAN
ncbi:MAG: ATP-binding protein [Spirulinaceae cyanobacterium]